MKKLGVLALIASMILALVTVLAPAASAVTQGTAIKTAEPWSAFIQYDKKYLFGQLQSDNDCTGTVVADGWVLTAAHCVTHEVNGALTKRVLDLRTFHVVLGRNNLNQPRSSGRDYTVDRIVLFTGYSPSTGTGDIALMKLHGALIRTALPLPLAPIGAVPANGVQLHAYGYGNVSETYKSSDLDKGILSNYTGQFPQVNYLHVTVPGSYVIDQTFDLAGGCTSTVICLHRVGASGILHGDSGGPWVASTSNPSITAVTHGIASPRRTSKTTLSWHYATADPVTTSDAHAWLTNTTGIVVPAVNVIVRNPATRAAWLIKSDGLAYPIATGGTYNCLTSQGHKVANLNTFALAEIPKSTTKATCTASSLGSKKTVLLYGDGDANQDPSGLTNIASDLTSDGLNVTTVAGNELPTDLTPYGQIWQYGITPSSTADEARLEAFIAAGGSVFLTGEYGTTSNFANLTVQDIVQVEVSPSIAVSGEVLVDGALPVNATAIDNLASNPHALSTWSGVAVGGLSGVAPANVLFANSLGDPVVAAWEAGGAGGRLVVVMDVNWAQTNYGDGATIPQNIQNIGQFLSN